MTSRLDLLTKTERAIAERAASELSPADIAREAFISKRTVDAHLNNIFKKFNINSRYELIEIMREEMRLPSIAVAPDVYVLVGESLDALREMQERLQTLVEKLERYVSDETPEVEAESGP